MLLHGIESSNVDDYCERKRHFLVLFLNRFRKSSLWPRPAVTFFSPTKSSKAAAAATLLFQAIIFHFFVYQKERKRALLDLKGLQQTNKRVSVNRTPDSFPNPVSQKKY